MKRLIIAALLLVSITAFSQRGNGPHHRDIAENLSAQEVATLQTKKMALALALDEGQVKRVYPLILEQVKERKATREARKAQEDKPKLTDKQRYEKVNEGLDKRIAMQNKMKDILTAEQFEKFQKMNARKGKKGRKGHNNDRKRGRGKK